MLVLTKSLFQIGHECPTRLYYSNHPELFANKKTEDPFLQALADGGLQVAELARKYYPSVHQLEIDHDEALKTTSKLLKQDVITLHEAAFKAKPNLFVRADIVVKTGDVLKLIEVKAKSYSIKEPMLGKKGDLVAGWKPYIYDLAFQYLVVSSAYKDLKVEPFLLLVDKDKVATIEGLYQMFRIRRSSDSSQPVVECAVSDREALGEEILSLVDMSDVITDIMNKPDFENQGCTFREYVARLAKLTEEDTLEYQPVSKKCKECEFIASVDEKKLRSGMMECFTNAFPGLSLEELSRPKFYDVAHIRKEMATDKFFMEDLEIGDIDTKGELGEINAMTMLNRTARQWQQVLMEKERRTDPLILRRPLQQAISDFTWPLHFIDFETYTPALPFHKEMRPYEMIAFQFSHHVLHRDGKVEHVDEWINEERGVFPNFRFLRALKASLSGDNGTIFRYSTHENTVLRAILQQVIASEETDREDLIAFIEEITSVKDEKCGRRTGSRAMVDLCEFAMNYYLHPRMKGSYSIKKVLPAVLNSSKFLKEKYSRPVYGTEEMPSRNFRNWIWLKEEGGEVLNPYHMLDPLYVVEVDEQLDQIRIENNGAINNGGAAMIAYAEMQNSDLSPETVKQRITSLKRYCELDTLAMVMVMEGFMNMK